MKFFKTIALIALFFQANIAVYAQGDALRMDIIELECEEEDQEEEEINWLTWEEALEKSKTEHRKIFVDVYTEWCGWCKKMDQSTFSEKHIAKYINRHYYAVKFDAEQKEAIEFNGKTYKFVKQGMRGYHELAVAITKGQLSYPTIVFLDETLNVIQPIPGYRSAEEFEMIMTYFGQNRYKDTPWPKHQEEYQSMDLDKQ